MTDAPTIRRPLAGSELTLALSGLEGSVLRERSSLEAETDPILYSETLLTMAGREERGDHPELAARYYSELLQSETSPANVRERARRRLAGLRGEGEIGDRAERLLGRLFQEASDPSALFAMTVAGTVFRGVRALGLARAMSSPSAGLLSRGFGARLFAGSLGFAAEATIFPLALRAGNLALHRTQDWSARALGHDLASSFMTLGALRVGGFVPRALAGQNSMLRPAMEQLGMFGGILLSHELEIRAGFRERSYGSAMLLGALSTLLQFNIAGRIQRGLVGESIGPWERNLEARSESLARLPEPPPSSGGILAEPLLAAAGARKSPSRNELIGTDSVYMTQGGDGGNGRSIPQLLIRAASLRIRIAPPEAWNRRDNVAREYLTLLQKLPSGHRASLNEIISGVEMLGAWAAHPNHFLSAIGHRYYAEAWRILRDKFSHVQSHYALEEQLVAATRTFQQQVSANQDRPLALRKILDAAPAITSILNQARLGLPKDSPRDMKMNEAMERVLANLRGGAMNDHNPLRAEFYRAWLDSLYAVHGRDEMVAHEAVAGIKALERELSWRGHQARTGGKVNGDPSLEFYPRFWRLFRDAVEGKPLHGIDFNSHDRIAFLRIHSQSNAHPEIREAVLQAFPFYAESQLALHSHHGVQLRMMLDVFTSDGQKFRSAILMAKNPEARQQFVEAYVGVMSACRFAATGLESGATFHFQRDVRLNIAQEMAEGLQVLRDRWTNEIGEFQVRSLEHYWRLAKIFSASEAAEYHIGSGVNIQPLVALSASNRDPRLQRAASDLMEKILKQFPPEDLVH